MTKKVLFLAMLFALAFGLGFIAPEAEAQTATFPTGCASGLGYSATTGEPCNGTNTATARFMPGCTSALGYSATTGEPCSGGSVAITRLAGCASIIGFSSITGEPCNGTNSVTPSVVVPGLPTTGVGGGAIWTIISLLALAGTALFGGNYLRKGLKLK